MTSTATPSDFKGTGATWFGVLAGPAAWCVQIVIGYNLEDFLCAPGSDTRQWLGLGIESALTVVSLALVAVTILGGIVSFRNWKRASHNGTPGGRSAWMGLAGVMVSIQFLIAIVLGLAPALFLSACDPPL